MVKVKDEGSRQEYGTGARRDNPEGKGKMNLLPAASILRLSRWYEAGALKYGENNWQKGMPNSRYIDAALRHLFKYLAGCQDEDHLSAAAWNICAVMWNEHYLPEQQDIPELVGRNSPFVYELDLGEDLTKEQP